MQAGVVSTFQLDEIKRVARLFCLFEDVIDEMELGSELTIPDPDKFPPVESVRYNRVVQGIGDDEVMDAIDNAEDVPGLRTLLVPYIDHPVGLTRASTYKMKLHKHRPTTELMFNNYPTTTYGDNIVRFMEVNAKFAQYALVHDDKTIECCRPSLDVFFDDIICDGKLTQFYDPRHPRRPRPGVMSCLSCPTTSLDGSHSICRVLDDLAQCPRTTWIPILPSCISAVLVSGVILIRSYFLETLSAIRGSWFSIHYVYYSSISRILE